MYKILNKIFGWDYVYWNYLTHSEIRRVRTLPDGRLYFLKYNKFITILDGNEEEKIVWLTCLPKRNNYTLKINV